MSWISAVCGFILLAAAAVSTASAASLTVEPALLDVPAPGAAAAITLRNAGDQPMTVQVRVYRWSQDRGRESLEPTDAVVASPPAVSIAAGSETLVRVVRLGKRPAEREESYRLLVDELPTAPKLRPGTIKLLIRHSVPVFFGPPERGAPSVSWSLGRTEGGLVLTARNRGETRLRLSDVVLTDAGGRSVRVAAGLLGYALGGSTMSWPVPGAPRGFGAKGGVTIAGQGNDGPFDAKARAAP